MLVLFRVVNLSLSFVSLNARGLRNNVKRKALFLFAKQFKSDIFFFQESHSTLNDDNFWRSQWGNSIWLSHGTERSAGVATLKNRFSGEILRTECDPVGHFICHAIKCNDKIILIANIYGYNNRTENVNLLLSIENILVSWLNSFPNAILLLGGDFNMVLNSELDKWPSGHRNRSSTFSNVLWINLI